LSQNKVSAPMSLIMTLARVNGIQISDHGARPFNVELKVFGVGLYQIPSDKGLASLSFSKASMRERNES